MNIHLTAKKNSSRRSPSNGNVKTPNGTRNTIFPEQNNLWVINESISSYLKIVCLTLIKASANSTSTTCNSEKSQLSDSRLCIFKCVIVGVGCNVHLMSAMIISFNCTFQFYLRVTLWRLNLFFLCIESC